MSLRDHVAVVAPGLELDRRAALLAAARSRGIETSVDGDLRAARRRLSELEAETTPELAAARRRVAETAADIETHRERVATLRGRLQERDDEARREAYRDAVRELSEAETERAAAREALRAARKRAREARDTRERRLRLEDRIGNLERLAREERLEAARPMADDAVAAAPGSDATAFGAAGPVTAALALVRVGRPEVPVTLACRRFPDAAAAEEWLGAPVVRL